MVLNNIVIVGNQAFSLLNFRGALIEELVARGHSVFAIAPNIDAEAARSLKSLGAVPVEISLSRTGLNPVSDLVSLVRLWRQLRRIRPTVVLSYAAKPAIYGTLAAWLACVPRRFAMIEGLGYVFTAREHDTFATRTLRRTVKVLFGIALRRASRVFFLNDDDLAEFSAMGLVTPQQAVNIGGIGVDLSVWEPAEPVYSPMTFTFVGRLLRDKGLNEFIEAARRVKSEYPSTRFLVVGGLDDNPESIGEKDVRDWVAEGLIDWPGHVPVRPWLAQTSVFVLPSYREGVPRSTQEAMAMARPVITTDAPGCRETVIEGRNGFLVPPRDAGALADAMRKFVLEPNLVMDMGRESRILAQERFDVHKVNACMMKIMGL